MNKTIPYVRTQPAKQAGILQSPTDDFSQNFRDMSVIMSRPGP